MSEPERRRCLALSKRGEPCRVAPLRGSDYCNVHDPSSPVAMRFQAGPEHTKSPGRPTLPTSTELRVARWNELVASEWDRIEAIYRSGLRAKQTATYKGEVCPSDVDDLGFQRDTAEALLERLDGRPRQAVEMSGSVGVQHAIDLSGLSAEELRQLLELLGKTSPGPNVEGEEAA